MFHEEASHFASIYPPGASDMAGPPLSSCDSPRLLTGGKPQHQSASGCAGASKQFSDIDRQEVIATLAGTSTQETHKANSMTTIEIGPSPRAPAVENTKLTTDRALLLQTSADGKAWVVTELDLPMRQELAEKAKSMNSRHIAVSKDEVAGEVQSALGASKLGARRHLSADPSAAAASLQEAAHRAPPRGGDAAKTPETENGAVRSLASHMESVGGRRTAKSQAGRSLHSGVTTATFDTKSIRRFYATNARLRAESSGICYARSRASRDLHEFRFLRWGEIVSGLDLGDGWLAVPDNSDEMLFMPMKIKGQHVLLPIGDDDKIVAEGELLKLNGVEEFGWSPRWCVLKPSALELFSASSRRAKRSRKGVVTLGADFLAARIQDIGRETGEADLIPEELVRQTLEEHPHCLVVAGRVTVESPQRFQFFSACDERTMNYWIDAVNKCAGVGQEVLAAVQPVAPREQSLATSQAKWLTGLGGAHSESRGTCGQTTSLASSASPSGYSKHSRQSSRRLSESPSRPQSPTKRTQTQVTAKFGAGDGPSPPRTTYLEAPFPGSRRPQSTAPSQRSSVSSKQSSISKGSGLTSIIRTASAASSRVSNGGESNTGSQNITSGNETPCQWVVVHELGAGMYHSQLSATEDVPPFATVPKGSVLEALRDQEVDGARWIYVDGQGWAPEVVGEDVLLCAMRYEDPQTVFGPDCLAEVSVQRQTLFATPSDASPVGHVGQGQNLVVAAMACVSVPDGEARFFFVQGSAEDGSELQGWLPTGSSERPVCLPVGM